MFFRKKRNSTKTKETMKKVYEKQLVLNKCSNRRISLKERHDFAKKRMLTKFALDNIKISDVSQRQEVHKLVDRIFTRFEGVHQANRSFLADDYARNLLFELETVLGGKKKRIRFFKEYEKLLNDSELVEKEIVKKEIKEVFQNIQKEAF